MRGAASHMDKEYFFWRDASKSARARRRAPGSSVRIARHRAGARGALGVIDVANGVSVLAARDASSPWACVNLVLIFLLIVLPGAKARTERPLHPLPQWLRQALRFIALLAFGFAMFSVGAFVWSSGWRRSVAGARREQRLAHRRPGALCRRHVDLSSARALAHEYSGASRSAVMRISLDSVTRTAVVSARKPQARPVRCA